MTNSVSEKLAIAAGSLSVAAVPAAADAALVTVTDNPLSVSMLSTPYPVEGVMFVIQDLVPWDIDGDNTPDFYLRALAGILQNSWTGNGFFESRAGALLINAGEAVGLSVIAHPVNRVILNGYGLEGSMSVGPGLNGYVWVDLAHAYIRRNLSVNLGVVAQSSSGYDLLGGGTNDFVVGFRFEMASNVHYGFANATLTSGPDWSLTINSWTYDDTPGALVHVPAIPAPPAGVAALSLLAMGAAGVRQWRKRQAQAAA